MTLYRMASALYLLSFLIASTAAADLTCPKLQSPFAQCSTNVVILVDASTTMDTHDKISQEFAYVMDSILPVIGYNNGQFVSIASFGSNGLVTSNPLIATESVACAQLNRLRDNSQALKISAVTLLTAFQNIAVNYNNAYVILLTGSKNQNDITATANYYNTARKFNGLSIVAFNGGDYSSFYVPVYPIHEATIAPKKYPFLPQCLMLGSCGSTNQCSATSGPAPTQPPTTQPPPTTPPTTTPSPTTQPVADIYSCRCQYNTSWNDIIFLFSTSSSMSSRGLIAVVNDMQSAMDNFNVQTKSYTASKYFTRVGIIGYGATASVIAPLGSVDNNAIDNINVPYTGGDVTNLEAAIQAAVQQFNANPRPSSRQVIYLFTSAYNGNGVHDPRTAAATFRGTGGVIVVYDYVQVGGAPDTVMKEVASPGYFLDSRTATANDQMQVLCDANCFCGSDQSIFKSDPTRQFPVGGCFTDAGGVQLTYARASSFCASAGPSGAVAKVESVEKAKFIDNLFDGTVAWIGLTWNTFYSKYQWADGSFLGSYAPWAASPVIPPPQYQTSVTMIKNGNQNPTWNQEYASNGYSHTFVCQTATCDSSRWCDRSVV